MITVFSPEHRQHHGEVELLGNKLVPVFERPERAEEVHARVVDAGFGEVRPPTAHGLDAARRVHDAALVDFLGAAWNDWTTLARDGDALPMTWRYARTSGRVPGGIEGRLGQFSFDAGTPIMAGTWPAATVAVDVALTGVDLVLGGERTVFSLCRPPGHHAGRTYYGGYCYLNNAAIAADALSGAGRVAILDIDYHHGNGTQDIFWSRADVLYVSLHATPDHEYPFFTGYADETGAAEGEGEGATLNLPMPFGTTIDGYTTALDTATAAIRRFAPDALVVSLGCDTFERDPICFFKLRTEDYLRVGSAIGALHLPTLYVMEGGYAIDALGHNVVNVLTGHLA